MPKRLLALLLAALLLTPLLASMATPTFKKGGMSGSYYSSPSGISFNVPEGFTLFLQENRKDGYFRIAFDGPYDAKYFGPAICIDIVPGGGSVASYTAKKLVSDLQRYPLGRQDKYVSPLVLVDRVIDIGGTEVRENLVVFRLDRAAQARVAFSYSYTYNTGSNLVRASYLSFGAQRTLTEDIPKFRDLFDTLVVP